jgi:nucleoside-diphosphate-sugar epimerase
VTTSTAIVTGAAGFVGSHPVHAPLASGTGVVGVSQFVAEPGRTWCDASCALPELGRRAAPELADGLRAQVGDLAAVA